MIGSKKLTGSLIIVLFLIFLSIVIKPWQSTMELLHLGMEVG